MAIIRRPRARSAAPMTDGIAREETVRETKLSPYAVGRRAAPRQRELLDAILQLDTKTDERARRELMDFVGSLYEEAGGGVPLALFAKCYLGAPYLDHIVTFAGEIAEHFTHSQPVPHEYRAARPLARNDAYAFIEVYSDGQVVPVRIDGTAVV